MIDYSDLCFQLRNRHRLTQREFAERFGLGFHAVRALEQRRFDAPRSVRVLLVAIDLAPEAVAKAAGRAE